VTVVNFKQREITFNLVYYGTGLGGKTTNLKYVHSGLPDEVKSEFISVATATDRTLFFDFVQMDLGLINNFKTRLALYTVPGQEEYFQSRRLLLKGVDGIVFVADSNPARAQANRDSIADMLQNLKANDLDISEVPWVLQYNKQDLVDAMSLESMDRDLNFAEVPSFASVATKGTAVLQTLQALTRLVLSKQPRVD
jgi:signal recognition particle receptor subunit beta